MKKLAVVIGARPQFIKHCPVEIELGKIFDLVVIHTGQHYDASMSDVFFNELKMNQPAYMLNIGGGTHGVQTALMLQKIEEILLSEKPDGIVLYGDTNSTIAGAIAASKLHIPVIHIEAGLRSYNKTMPEEVNRIVTDHVSSFLATPSQQAIDNLHKENITENIYEIGDVMHDMIRIAQEKIGEVERKAQLLVTLHRPYNVDNIERLSQILQVLNSLPYTCIFPIHPRTKANLAKHNIEPGAFGNIRFVQPVGYFDMIRNILESKCVITDSGGVQKEAYWMRTKCITLRTETEWTETLSNGWNHLVFDDLSKIKELVDFVPTHYDANIYGDSHAAKRLATHLAEFYQC